MVVVVMLAPQAMAIKAAMVIILFFPRLLLLVVAVAVLSRLVLCHRTLVVLVVLVEVVLLMHLLVSAVRLRHLVKVLLAGIRVVMKEVEAVVHLPRVQMAHLGRRLGTVETGAQPPLAVHR